jgi:hypothetical protein
MLGSRIITEVKTVKVILLTPILWCALNWTLTYGQYFPTHTESVAEGITAFHEHESREFLARINEPPLSEFTKDADAEVYHLIARRAATRDGAYSCWKATELVLSSNEASREFQEFSKGGSLTSDLRTDEVPSFTARRACRRVISDSCSAVRGYALDLRAFVRLRRVFLRRSTADSQRDPWRPARSEP